MERNKKYKEKINKEKNNNPKPRKKSEYKRNKKEKTNKLNNYKVGRNIKIIYIKIVENYKIRVKYKNI